MNPDLPAIKVKSAPALWKEGLKKVASRGLASIGAALSSAADQAPYDKHGLLQFLHVRLYELNRARSRQKIFPGRVWNRLAGSNPEYIELSGVHLGQTLHVIGREAPRGTVSTGTYLLHRDLVNKAYCDLRAELG